MNKILVILSLVTLWCYPMKAQTIESLSALVEAQEARIKSLEKDLAFEKCKNDFINYKQDLEITNCRLEEFELQLEDKRQYLLVNPKVPDLKDKQLLAMYKERLKVHKQQHAS